MKKPNIKIAILRVLIKEYPDCANWKIAQARPFYMEGLRRFRDMGLNYKYDKGYYWIYTPLKELKKMLKSIKEGKKNV